MGVAISLLLEHRVKVLGVLSILGGLLGGLVGRLLSEDSTPKMAALLLASV